MSKPIVFIEYYPRAQAASSAPFHFWITTIQSHLAALTVLFDNWVMILECQSIHEFLSRELARRVKVNSRYSQRGFARSLGLSPGELSEVLRNKRRLGLKAALRISQAMGLNSIETKHLVHLTQVEKSRSWNMDAPLTAEPAPLKSEQLDEDVFQIVSEWYYFATVTLTDCADFQWNSQWIAKRLGITRVEARVAMDRLFRLGLIVKENGRFKIGREYTLSPSGIPSTAIRNYHRQILNKAIAALETQPVQTREFSGISMSIDTKDIEAVKREISDFQDKLAAKYSKSKANEVYHLEQCFFKITESEEKKP